MRAPAPIAVVAAVAAVLLLGGCAQETQPTAAPTPTAEPTPKTTATAAPPEEPLFTITANVRDTTGATVGIQLTAFEALPYSDGKAKPLITEFIKTCGAGVGGTPVTAETLSANGSILMRIELAASATGKGFQVPLELSLGSPYFGQAAVGAGIAPADPSHPCYGGYTWSTSGTVAAVADFESGSPGPDLTLWQFANYGFAVPFNSDATIEACTVVLSEQAAAAVGGHPGWDPAGAANGVSCLIGYTGE